MPRFDVTTIGEGQLRYSVSKGHMLINAPQFDVHVSGTEANVACWLSQLGWRCGWVSSLPNNPLGKRVLKEYEAYGVDTSAVHSTDQFRLATYYVEFGGLPKGTHVFYDRKDSAFVNMTVENIDWDYLLDTRVVHLSGLTVPLSGSVFGIMSELIQRAKARGIPISFDMNYRSRIWTPEDAAKTIIPLLADVNILFFSRSDARVMFGAEGDPEDVVREIAAYTSAQHVVTSLSKDGIIAWDGSDYHLQPAKTVEVIDRIGAGDAMVAGVLHGWLQGDIRKGLRYGVTTAALALTHYGDRIFTTSDKLDELLNSTRNDIVR